MNQNLKTLNNIIVRKYTKELESSPDKTVFDLFRWKRVSVKLVDFKKNKVLFEKDNLEFPEHYSQMACDIISSKYFRMAGVPDELGYEHSMRQVAHRMVDFWVKSAINEGLVEDGETSQILYDELVYMFLSQMWAPNSPQWFNTGLKTSYGIEKASEGNFYFDIEKGEVVLSEDAYTRTSGSACFIISINDALLGQKSLSEQVVTETRLFKQGAGTGTNFSNIRGLGEKLSGGGTSSGLMSFLRVFDRNAGAIKSGGTTRRAAKIVTLDADHPEIFDYIKWKSREEDKVRALAKMGYSSDFNGEAYDTVSGQNSNNSVRFTHDLMRKMLGEDENSEWELKGRVDQGVNRKVDAKELWEEFNKASWACADPAPQFHDTSNEWHTCPAGEDGIYNAKHNRINASNPCSEFFFLDDTACNLASINVAKFYDATKDTFDLEGYEHCIALCQIVLEATIHWGQFPTEDIARKSHLFRPTGLGIANTGALHMMMAHPYESDEARAVASALMGIITGHSYYVSSLMAQKVGAFPKYDINKEHMLRVIRNHARVAGAYTGDYEGLSYKPVEVDHELLKGINHATLSQTLIDSWAKAVVYGNKYGFRNAQVTVIAPTGTISLAMDCASTSIEPFFAHIVYKKLSGGGYLELVNPAIEVALRKLGYTETQIKDIVDYVIRKENIYGYDQIVDGKIEGAPHLKDEHLPIFDTANKCGTGTRYISPMGHVLMTASLTPLISGAISKTVNLPNSATIEDFKKVHEMAWRLGVKAIALYRDGSKASQPLNSAKTDETVSLESLTYQELLTKTKELQDQVSKPAAVTRNRPYGIRYSRVHEANVSGLKLYVTLTFYEDGKISEIYMTADREGTIVKGMLDSLSKMISKMLQHNIPAEDIAHSLEGQKYEPHGFVTGHPYIKSVDSLSDLISKIIKIELGDFSTCQVKPAKGEFVTQKQICDMLSGNVIFSEEENNIIEEVAVTKDTKNAVKVFGKTCSNCNSTNMAKNGTCHICLDCGTTTGCS